MVLKKLTQDFNSYGLPVDIATFRDNISSQCEATLDLVTPYAFVIMMTSHSKKLLNHLSQLFAETSSVKRSMSVGSVYLQRSHRPPQKTGVL